jgi:hypothetical protein
MLKTLFKIILALKVIVSVGQITAAQTVTNWGDLASGFQLAVDLSNQVVFAGADTMLTCWIKNSSTNVGSTPAKTWAGDFYVILTNNSGKFYELTPNPDRQFAISQGIGRPIKPGSVAGYRILLPLSADITPGHYSLLTKRSVVLDGKTCKLTSILLEIQVKPGTNLTNTPVTSKDPSGGWAQRFPPRYQELRTNETSK